MRIHSRITALSTALVLALAAVPASVDAQTSTDARKKPVEKSARTWTPPHTAWGDPDISGNVTNVFEASKPFERPDEFSGRSRDDVKGEELATYRAKLQQRSVDNFEGPLHGPDHWWQDIYDLRKGGQAWFVIDPPDGKIPPLTEEVKQHPRAAGPAGSYGEAEKRGPEDFTLYD